MTKKKNCKIKEINEQISLSGFDKAVLNIASL